MREGPRKNIILSVEIRQNLPGSQINVSSIKPGISYRTHKATAAYHIHRLEPAWSRWIRAIVRTVPRLSTFVTEVILWMERANRSRSLGCHSSSSTAWSSRPRWSTRRRWDILAIVRIPRAYISYSILRASSADSPVPITHRVIAVATTTAVLSIAVFAIAIVRITSALLLCG